ncbi:hypothetical protein FHG87_008114 [Trinorchestia longiramus]|nr:hypothetical protein FHG87_008114 [Trinorchestia longiramus]
MATSSKRESCYLETCLDGPPDDVKRLNDAVRFVVGSCGSSTSQGTPATNTLVDVSKFKDCDVRTPANGNSHICGGHSEAKATPESSLLLSPSSTQENSSKNIPNAMEASKKSLKSSLCEVKVPKKNIYEVKDSEKKIFDLTSKNNNTERMCVPLESDLVPDKAAAAHLQHDGEQDFSCCDSLNEGTKITSTVLDCERQQRTSSTADRSESKAKEARDIGANDGISRAVKQETRPKIPYEKKREGRPGFLPTLRPDDASQPRPMERVAFQKDSSKRKSVDVKSKSHEKKILSTESVSAGHDVSVNGCPAAPAPKEKKRNKFLNSFTVKGILRKMEKSPKPVVSVVPDESSVNEDKKLDALESKTCNEQSKVDSVVAEESFVAGSVDQNTGATSGKITKDDDDDVASYDGETYRIVMKTSYDLAVGAAAPQRFNKIVKSSPEIQSSEPQNNLSSPAAEPVSECPPNEAKSIADVTSQSAKGDYKATSHQETGETFSLTSERCEKDGIGHNDGGKIVTSGSEISEAPSSSNILVDGSHTSPSSSDAPPVEIPAKVTVPEKDIVKNLILEKHTDDNTILEKEAVEITKPDKNKNNTSYSEKDSSKIISPEKDTTRISNTGKETLNVSSFEKDNTINNNSEKSSSPVLELPSANGSKPLSSSEGIKSAVSTGSLKGPCAPSVRKKVIKVKIRAKESAGRASHAKVTDPSVLNVAKVTTEASVSNLVKTLEPKHNKEEASQSRLTSEELNYRDPIDSPSSNEASVPVQKCTNSISSFSTAQVVACSSPQTAPSVFSSAVSRPLIIPAVTCVNKAIQFADNVFNSISSDINSATSQYANVKVDPVYRTSSNRITDSSTSSSSKMCVSVSSEMPNTGTNVSTSVRSPLSSVSSTSVPNVPVRDIEASKNLPLFCGTNPAIDNISSTISPPYGHPASTCVQGRTFPTRVNTSSSADDFALNTNVSCSGSSHPAHAYYSPIPMVDPPSGLESSLMTLQIIEHLNSNSNDVITSSLNDPSNSLKLPANTTLRIGHGPAMTISSPGTSQGKAGRHPEKLGTAPGLSATAEKCSADNQTTEKISSGGANGEHVPDQRPSNVCGTTTTVHEGSHAETPSEIFRAKDSSKEPSFSVADLDSATTSSVEVPINFTTTQCETRKTNMLESKVTSPYETNSVAENKPGVITANCQPKSLSSVENCESISKLAPFISNSSKDFSPTTKNSNLSDRKPSITQNSPDSPASRLSEQINRKKIHFSNSMGKKSDTTIASLGENCKNSSVLEKSKNGSTSVCVMKPEQIYEHENPSLNSSYIVASACSLEVCGKSCKENLSDLKCSQAARSQSSQTPTSDALIESLGHSDQSSLSNVNTSPSNYSSKNNNADASRNCNAQTPESLQQNIHEGDSKIRSNSDSIDSLNNKHVPAKRCEAADDLFPARTRPSTCSTGENSAVQSTVQVFPSNEHASLSITNSKSHSVPTIFSLKQTKELKSSTDHSNEKIQLKEGSSDNSMVRIKTGDEQTGCSTAQIHPSDHLSNEAALNMRPQTRPAALINSCERSETDVITRREHCDEESRRNHTTSEGRHTGIAEAYNVDCVLEENADAGSEISAHIGREVNADIGREVSTDISSEVSTDISREVSTDIGREDSTDVGREVSNDIGCTVSADIGREVSTDVGCTVRDASVSGNNTNSTARREINAAASNKSSAGAATCSGVSATPAGNGSNVVVGSAVSGAASSRVSADDKVDSAEGNKIDATTGCEVSVPSKCKGSVTSKCEGSVPSKSEISVPSKSEISVPSKSEVSVPSKSEVSVPSKSEVSVPSKSEVSVRSKSEVSVPSKSEVSVPSKSEISVPSKSEISVPSKSEISVPPKNEASVPSKSEISVPFKSEISVPSKSEISVPSKSEISVPSKSEISVPPKNEISVPSKSEISVPSKSEISVPPKNEASVPPKSEISVPPKNEISVPPKNEISVPPKNEISVPPKNEASGSTGSEVIIPTENEVSAAADSGSFSRAMSRQNQHLLTAINCLGDLTEHIGQFFKTTVQGRASKSSYSSNGSRSCKTSEDNSSYSLTVPSSCKTSEHSSSRTDNSTSASYPHLRFTRAPSQSPPTSLRDESCVEGEPCPLAAAPSSSPPSAPPPSRASSPPQAPASSPQAPASSPQAPASSPQAPALSPKDYASLEDAEAGVRQKSVVASVELMRHLLSETQEMLRRMVDENQHLAMRMDGELQAAQQQVRDLRQDLQETKSKITQLQSFSSSPHLPTSSQRIPISQSKIPSSVTRNSSPKMTSKIPVNVSKSYPTDGAVAKPRSLSAEGRRKAKTQENGEVGDSDHSSGNSGEQTQHSREGLPGPERSKGVSAPRKISSASTASDGSRTGAPDAGVDNNSRTGAMKNVSTGNVSSAGNVSSTGNASTGNGSSSPIKDGGSSDDGTAGGAGLAGPGGTASQPPVSDNNQVTHLVTELCHAKEALAALKADRKRLKTEKVDLLQQMKQLYATLEDKEAELRDFIRNFEQRMAESEESERRLRAEREAGERERWGLLNRLGEESDRAARLVATLTARDRELHRMRQQMASLGYQSDGDSSFPSSGGLVPPTTSPPTTSPHPTTSSALTPSTSAPLPLSSDGGISHHPMTPSASAPNTINSTPNGRGSSADSGVRLSSDRDSTASHEGAGTGTPPKDTSCIYATPHMHNNIGSKSLSTRGGTNPYHTTSLYSTSPPHTLPYSTYSASPPPLACLPRNGHLMESGSVPAYSSNALYGGARPGGSDTPRSIGGLGSEGSSEGCDYSGPPHGSSLYSSCNTPSSDRSVRVGLSQSTEQLCNTVAEAAEQALLHTSASSPAEGQAGAPKAAKSSKGASMTLSRKTQKALGGGGGGGGGGTWGSISRVFARQKKRNALDSSLYDGAGASSSEDMDPHPPQS